jgi:hypothetical protein
MASAHCLKVIARAAPKARWARSASRASPLPQLTQAGSLQSEAMEHCRLAFHRPVLSH